jgi:hypothetical protein
VTAAVMSQPCIVRDTYEGKHLALSRLVSLGLRYASRDDLVGAELALSALGLLRHIGDCIDAWGAVPVVITGVAQGVVDPVRQIPTVG